MQSRGLENMVFPIDIGCSGYPGNSSWRVLKMLEIVSKDKWSLLKDAVDNAETTFMWIWR